MRLLVDLFVLLRAVPWFRFYCDTHVFLYDSTSRIENEGFRILNMRHGQVC